MTINTREIVRDLMDAERGFPCVVAHEDAGGPCERTATMAVYGLAFCEEHGEECAAGAYEEIHQDAHDFFERLDAADAVGLPNPWVRRAVRDWRLTVPAGELGHEERVEELLLRVFPFRAELVDAESAGQVADPIPENGHPVDYWRDDRRDIHALMRAAYARGMDWLVGTLERDRESVAAQLAYAWALDRGEHPEVLERVHRENVESVCKVAEHFAQKYA